jgi:hypothetical protein
MATDAGRGILDILDEAAGEPTYYLTRAVRGEAVHHNVGGFLESLDAVGRLEIVKNDYRAANARRERLYKVLKAATPGNNDCGLLVLCEKYGHVLVTDDAGLYEAGLTTSVATLDLLDCCVAAEHAGVCSRQELLELFSCLKEPSPHFQPLGWKPLVDKSQAKWPDAAPNLVDQRRDPELLAELMDGAG